MRPLRPSGRAPFVAQMTPSECMVACLAMVLAWNGRPLPVSRIRNVVPIGPAGTSAFDAAQAAGALGLSCQALRVPIGKLTTLEPGAILHWEARHFVVFERALSSGIWIADPAFGRRFVSGEELSLAFDGLALVFRPSGEPAKPEPRSGAAERMARLGSFFRFLGPVTVAALFTRLSSPLLMSGIILLVPQSDSRLGQVALAIAVFVFIQWGAAWLRESLTRKAATRVEARLGGAMTDALLGASCSFVGVRSPAALAQRFQSIASASALLVESRLTLVSDGVFVFVGVLVLLLSTPAVAGLLIALTVGQVLTLRWLGEVEERSISAAGYARGRLLAFEAATTRRLAQAPIAGEELTKTTTQWSALRRRAALPDRSLTTATRETLGISAPLVFMWAAALQASDESSSYALVVGANCLAVTVMRAALSLFRAVETLPVARSAIERAEDLLQASASSAEALAPATPPSSRGGSVACSMRPAH